MKLSGYSDGIYDFCRQILVLWRNSSYILAALPFEEAFLDLDILSRLVRLGSRILAKYRAPLLSEMRNTK